MTLCVVRTPQIRSCLAAVEGHPRLLADRLAGVLSRGARQSLRVRHIYGLSAQEHSRSDHRVGVHCLRHNLPERKMAWNYAVSFALLIAAVVVAFAFKPSPGVG